METSYPSPRGPSRPVSRDTWNGYKHPSRSHFEENPEDGTSINHTSYRGKWRRVEGKGQILVGTLNPPCLETTTDECGVRTPVLHRQTSQTVSTREDVVVGTAPSDGPRPPPGDGATGPERLVVGELVHTPRVPEIGPVHEDTPRNPLARNPV